MLLHDEGKEIPVLRQGKAFNRCHAGEGLEPELAGIAEQMIAVIRKGLQSMPDIPVMAVAPVFILRFIKASAGRGTGRPVESLRIFLLHHLRQDILIQFDVIGNQFLIPVPESIGYKGFNLVVAAPQRQRGMMPQPADIVPELGADAVLKVFAQIIGCTGKHKVLPDQQAQFIADIIKPVVRIITAAPDTNGIHVGCSRVFQQVPGPLRGNPWQQIVLRDIVCAHGKHIQAVHAVAEALAPAVLFPADCHRTQADPLLPGVENTFRPGKRNLHVIKRLITVPGRPPELRVVNCQAAIRAFCCKGLSVRCRNGYGDPGFSLAQLFSPGNDVQPDSAPFMILQHGNIPQHGRICPDQFDIPPDSRVRKMGAPVPAEHAVCLAQIWKSAHRVG